MPHLSTKRLRMVSWTVELIDTALHDTEHLGILLGAKIPEGFPIDPVRKFVLPKTRTQLRSDPSAGIWSGTIIHSEDNLAIGTMGFKAPPAEQGIVEIGYDIMPSYQGNGYATEMARALIRWALAQPSVTRITAECLPDNWASIRVLEKLGMQRIIEHKEMLHWELPSPQ